MEQWSILSNLLNYVQQSMYNSMDHSSNVKPGNRYKVKPNEEKKFRDVDFSTNLKKITNQISRCV